MAFANGLPKVTVAAGMIALTLFGCAPKEENKAVAALKKEKTSWERESNLAAKEATDAVESAHKEVAKEVDEIQ